MKPSASYPERNITLPLVNLFVNRISSCEVMVVNRLYDLEGNEFRDRVIFGNMVFQALEAQTNNTKDTNTLALRVSQYNSLAVGTNFTA
jgi:hypothetical protein